MVGGDFQDKDQASFLLSRRYFSRLTDLFNDLGDFVTVIGELLMIVIGGFFLGLRAHF